MLEPYSYHAAERARTRAISPDAIDATLQFGRCRRDRGAEIFTLGWREIRRYAHQIPDLARWEGTEVVCSYDGTIVTVYRNRHPHALRDRALRRAA